jgi:hypothetical protein
LEGSHHGLIEVLPSDCLGGGEGEENHEIVRIANVSAEIQTECLLNINPEHYHYTKLLG